MGADQLDPTIAVSAVLGSLTLGKPLWSFLINTHGSNSTLPLNALKQLANKCVFVSQLAINVGGPPQNPF
jgi:hypothetical protein